MSQLIIFIFIGLAGVWLGSFLARGKRTRDVGSLEQARQARTNKKNEAKDKILELVKEQGKINNDDVEKLLGVSDSTATNYLDELEQEGKIVQQGDVGRGVFYTLN